MVGNRWHRLSALMTRALLVAVGACSGRNGDANRADSATPPPRVAMWRVTPRQRRRTRRAR